METKPQKPSAENFVKEIRRKTRRIFSAEQKILIVREAPLLLFTASMGPKESVFYKWNKEFLEAGKKRLAGDTPREATSDEVTALHRSYCQRYLYTGCVTDVTKG